MRLKISHSDLADQIWDMMDGMGIEPHLYQQGFALLKWENRA